MKTHFLLVLLSLCFMPAFAEAEKSPLLYSVTGTSRDTSLAKDEALFVFTFHDPQQKFVKAPLQLGWNAEQKIAQPDEKGRAELRLKPGKYKLYFYNSLFNEIITDSIRIASRNRIEITVYFQEASEQVEVEKPVIYLYPQQPMDISVKLQVKGDLTFTYPKYDGGWQVKADPDGTIHSNGKNYSYLFWEAKMELQPQDQQPGSGFIVPREGLLQFLESSLQTIGFRPNEAQDFITYWYPRMMAHEKVYVHFLFNDEFSKYAPLEISPKPDQLIRVYMLWSPDVNGRQLDTAKPKLPSFERKGFTVFEWGGTQLEEKDSRSAQ